MDNEKVREFIDKENKKIILELAGQSRFEIIACLLMPDGDRLVTVVDHTTTEKLPYTYLYSEIPYTDDLDIQDLFIRHKHLIEDGTYDD
ncbi:hypothetical protein AAV35_012595 [Salimicrobium jeotgali]|uniref:Uncharacterized protein n=1 Tax=Salimicrobium jeotgali TaxID=1230341 RepID=K2G5K0_9BACI|nr:hypothetical protein [Salimicrobium jeotgali]AKG05511.1 hypothetical protein AAV35_012595 [Salimicrobium jeotgali]EKE30508.1 hypothetical protein MJ3_13744 [Salimicrobium jeotgali]MBM7696657.1 hypothetical protein [Salimicrobium jeotgali]